MSDETPTTPMPPAPADPPRKRLLRSREDKIAAGVSGGLARHFDVDPVIFRVGFVVTAFFGGFGVLAYLALFLFVAKDDGTAQPKPIVTLNRRTLLIAGAVVVAGAGGLALALGAAVAAAAGGGAAVAITVIGLGAAIAVSAFVFGRRARWLIVPALLIATPAVAVAASGFEIDGGIGEESHRPATVAAIPSGGYEHGVGEMRIDLSKLDFTAGRTIDLKARRGHRPGRRPGARGRVCRGRRPRRSRRHRLPRPSRRGRGCKPARPAGGLGRAAPAPRCARRDRGAGHP